MYISVKLLDKVWKVAPQSILHVGAHHAEEYEEYKKHDWIGVGKRKAIWVEAQKNLALTLSNRLPEDRNWISNYAVWHTDSLEINLNIASNSQSSSLFDFEKHLLKYPNIQMIGTERVITRRLDSILNDSGLDPDFLNLDIQGAELVAIKSLGEKVSNFKWIYTEVNFTSLYKQTPLIHEIDEYLSLHGFKRVVTYRVAGAGWGDALYIREGINFGGMNARFAAWNIRARNNMQYVNIILRQFHSKFILKK